MISLKLMGYQVMPKPRKAFATLVLCEGTATTCTTTVVLGWPPGEITETYKTKMESDGFPSAEFAQKSHINKWCHSESDRSATGNLRDSNESYSFYHLVHGQGPPVEVLAGSNAADIGFLKRFNVVFAAQL